MKKTLLSMAATLCVAGHGLAHAQTMVPKLTVFGTANAQLEGVQATGSAVPAQDKPARWRLSNVSSDLGVKASVVLNDSLTGVAQYTSGVSVDNASGNTSGGLWASAKDVFVGLRVANVGTVKLGRLTAAARWNSGTADFSPAGAGPQDDQAALSGVAGQSAAGPLFNVRVDNVIGFETESFGGFSARASRQQCLDHVNEHWTDLRPPGARPALSAAE